MTIDTTIAHARPNVREPITLMPPTAQMGAAIHDLIRQCRPLDLNSAYAYLLLGHFFAQTCIVAVEDDRVVGFISGLRPPEQPSTLFVWQVAVHPDARGRGLASQMLDGLLGRPALRAVTRIETTVSPSNSASRAMFSSLARRLDAPFREHALFGAQMFGNQGHEEERLIVIGPFTLDKSTQGEHA